MSEEYVEEYVGEDDGSYYYWFHHSDDYRWSEDEEVVCKVCGVHLSTIEEMDEGKCSLCKGE